MTPHTDGFSEAAKADLSRIDLAVAGFLEAVRHTAAYLRLAAVELRDMADRPLQTAGVQLRQIADGLAEDAAELTQYVGSIGLAAPSSGQNDASSPASAATLRSPCAGN